MQRLTVTLSDRYTIERELGQGGMATVYLARDLKHDRKVAIKVLKPELGAVLGAERFLSEIKVTANLQHPNLLPLFDSGTADGLLYYVMPYIEGETLRTRLDLGARVDGASQDAATGRRHGAGAGRDRGGGVSAGDSRRHVDDQGSAGKGQAPGDVAAASGH